MPWPNIGLIHIEQAAATAVNYVFTSSKQTHKVKFLKAGQWSPPPPNAILSYSLTVEVISSSYYPSALQKSIFLKPTSLVITPRKVGVLGVKYPHVMYCWHTCITDPIRRLRHVWKGTRPSVADVTQQYRTSTNRLHWHHFWLSFRLRISRH
jgi:hypothetical protein